MGSPGCRSATDASGVAADAAGMASGDAPFAAWEGGAPVDRSIAADVGGDAGHAADAGGDAGNADGAAAGASCSTERPCAGGLLCETTGPLLTPCGRSAVSGTCVARPAACPMDGSPVCGCDGVTYANDCLRQKAGAPLAERVACQGWEKGPVSCGAATCAPTQVCVRPGSTCGAQPPCDPAPDGGACPAGTIACNDFGRAGCRYSCSPPPAYCLDVPASCRDQPTCACLQPSNCHCEGINRGRFVTCGGAP